MIDYFLALHQVAAWIGIDHSFGNGPPLIFETMVFPSKDGPLHELDCDRYTREGEARRRLPSRIDFEVVGTMAEDLTGVSPAQENAKEKDLETRVDRKC